MPRLATRRPTIVEPRLAQILEETRAARGKVVVLTGAGISAESGIPTFRGQEGYWVVGSRNYMPQEMATRAMFDRSPEEVWRWYLYRFGVCRHAQPNDGQHRRAGSRRVFCIHGDAAWVRCADDCGVGLLDLPDLGVREKDDPLGA